VLLDLLVPPAIRAVQEPLEQEQPALLVLQEIQVLQATLGLLELLELEQLGLPDLPVQQEIQVPPEIPELLELPGQVQLVPLGLPVLQETQAARVQQVKQEPLVQLEQPVQPAPQEQLLQEHYCLL